MSTTTAMAAVRYERASEIGKPNTTQNLLLAVPAIHARNLSAQQYTPHTVAAIAIARATQPCQPLFVKKSIIVFPQLVRLEMIPSTIINAKNPATVNVIFQYQSRLLSLAAKDSLLLFL